MNENKAPRLIGGMFGLEPPRFQGPSAPCFMTGTVLLLASARCGIRLLCENLRPGRVWMPSYLCPSMLEGVPRHIHSRLEFFQVDPSLQIDDRKWLGRVQKGDLVFLIDYFGFPADTSLVSALKGKDAWVVEDASQALLSARAIPDADFALFSPRKFLGVPDGGIMYIGAKATDAFRGVRLQPPSAEWSLNTLRASVLRAEFDRHGGPKEWFDVFRRNEADIPVGSYGMSQTSELLLRSAVDYDLAARKRIANYKFLLQHLRPWALFPDLPLGVTPIGFPVRLPNRETVRQALFSVQIYPAIHWDLGRAVPLSYAESHRLSQCLLTLPCDQRYGEEEMSRICNSVLEQVEKEQER